MTRTSAEWVKWLVSHPLFLQLPEFIIRLFNAPNFIASAGFIVTSALANFAGRKLLVFKH